MSFTKLDSGSSSSESFTITVPAGTKLLVVGISSRDLTTSDRVISSVTCGTDTLTETVSVDDGVNTRANLYHKINPATGSKTITVTYAGVVGFTRVGWAAYSASGTPTKRETATNTGNSGTVSTNISPAQSSLLIDAAQSDNTSSGASPDAAQTSIYNVGGATRPGFGSDKSVSSGATSMSWTVGSARWTHVVAAWEDVVSGSVTGAAAVGITSAVIPTAKVSHPARSAPAIVFGVVPSAKVAAKGIAATSFAFQVVPSPKVTHATQSVVGASFAVSASGVVSHKTTSQITATFGVVAAGTVTGPGGESEQGQGEVDVVFGVVASGHVAVYGAATISLTMGVSATGHNEAHGAAVSSLQSSSAAAGRVAANGSAQVALTTGVTPTPRVAHTASAVAAPSFFLQAVANFANPQTALRIKFAGRRPDTDQMASRPDTQLVGAGASTTFTGEESGT